MWLREIQQEVVDMIQNARCHPIDLDNQFAPLVTLDYSGPWSPSLN